MGLTRVVIMYDEEIAWLVAGVAWQGTSFS